MNQIASQASLPQGNQSSEQEGELTFDPVRIWMALLDGRWWIASVTAAVFVLTTVMTLFSRMEFKIEGSLYLGDVQTQPFGGAEMFDFIGQFGQSELGSELEILKSRTLIEKAILET